MPLWKVENPTPDELIYFRDNGEVDPTEFKPGKTLVIEDGMCVKVCDTPGEAEQFIFDERVRQTSTPEMEDISRLFDTWGKS